MLMRILYSMCGLLKWLSTANPLLKGEHPRPTTFGLPDPNEETSNNAGPCASANAEIDKTKEAVGNVAVSMATTAEKREQRWQGMQMCMVCRPLPKKSRRQNLGSD